MPTALTDEQLATALRGSKLNAKDKRAIEPYIHQMSPADREELMGLIQKKGNVEKRIEETIRGQNEELLARAKEANSEMIQVVAKAHKQARGELEKMTSEDEKESLHNLEDQIKNS